MVLYMELCRHVRLGAGAGCTYADGERPDTNYHIQVGSCTIAPSPPTKSRFDPS